MIGFSWANASGVLSRSDSHLTVRQACMSYVTTAKEAVGVGAERSAGSEPRTASRPVSAVPAETRTAEPVAEYVPRPMPRPSI